MATDEFAMRVAMSVAKGSLRPTQKMGAIVMKGGRVLRTSANGRTTGRHAELLALADDRSFKGATIAVARVGGGTSKPCRTCFRVIKEAGVKYMIFIDGRGNRVRKKVSAEKETDYKDMGAKYD